MSYEIGRRHDGGFDYRVTINGLTMTGWRRGTHKDVEAYAKRVSDFSVHRANGGVPRANSDGSIRVNLNGKVKKQKKQPQQEADE